MERLTVGLSGIGTTSLLCGDLFPWRKQDGYQSGSCFVSGCLWPSVVN